MMLDHTLAQILSALYEAEQRANALQQEVGALKAQLEPTAHKINGVQYAPEESVAVRCT